MIDSSAHKRDKSRIRVVTVLEQLQRGIADRIDRFREKQRSRPSQTGVISQIDGIIGELSRAESLQQFLTLVTETLLEVSSISAVAVTVKPSLDAAVCESSAAVGFADVEDGDFELALDNSLVKAVMETDGLLYVRDLEGILGPRSRQRAMLRRIECDAVVGLQSGTDPLGLVLLQFSDDDASIPSTLKLYVPIIALILHNHLLRVQLSS